MPLSPEGLRALQQTAAHARQVMKDKRAARWHQHVAWAKRGAQERVDEILEELAALEELQRHLASN
jgi:hypothetical protein